MGQKSDRPGSTRPKIKTAHDQRVAIYIYMDQFKIEARTPSTQTDQEIRINLPPERFLAQRIKLSIRSLLPNHKDDATSPPIQTHPWRD
jgi:hypothetical protein